MSTPDAGGATHARLRVAVVGLGEVGRPLRDAMTRTHDVVGIDIPAPAAPIEHVDVMHICYPYAIADFVGETARYIDRLRPKLTIINSTVAVGTTRLIAERTKTRVVHSPVRGKHTRMPAELLRYSKFIGALDHADAQAAATLFQSVGMKTHIASSPEATELAKLTETTYFGVLIAWAQEVERYCDALGLRYDEVVAVWYPSRAAFLRLAEHPGYLEALAHRTAALEQATLIECEGSATPELSTPFAG